MRCGRGVLGSEGHARRLAQTSGRQQLNVHGALDLETGQTRMLDVVTVDAASTIMLLMAIQAMHPGKRVIHLFLSSWTMRDTITRSGCRPGWRGRGAGSSCTSSQPVVGIWTGSSDYGA